MKKHRIVLILIMLAVLIFILIICTSPGSAGSVPADGTTGGAVDTAPIPANSEFLKD